MVHEYGGYRDGLDVLVEAIEFIAPSLRISDFCHVSRAEQPETFPWRQIGDSQIVWPLFTKPDSLAGRKFFSAFSPGCHLVLTLY